MNNKKQTIKKGVTEALPLAIAIAAYGLSYGVLTTQTSLSLASVLAMSLFVFSGSVQMVAVAMLAAGATATSVLIATALLNLRNVLYGAALAEGLSPAPRKWRGLLSFGVSDEAFVLGSARFQKHGPDPLYFGIVAATFYLAWITSSYIGAVIGSQVDPLKWGLDLAFPVTFTAILIPSLRGKPVIATALVAVTITVILQYVTPGNEFTIILAGGLSPLIGLYVSRRTRDNE